MQAVKEFNDRRKQDFKRYRQIYKSKNPNETSLMYFKEIEDVYIGYTKEELLNLENYLEDIYSYNWAKHERSRILSGMDHKVAGVIPIFITSMISIIAIIISVNIGIFNIFANKDIAALKKLYVNLTDTCFSVMNVVKWSFFICVIFLVILGIFDARECINKCVEERFFDGYIKAVRKCIAKKYMDV